MLRSPSRFVLPALVAVVLVLSGCGQQTQPTAYGSGYQANFTFGCENQVKAEGGPRAPKTYCKCVYQGLVKRVSFADAKKFEEQQATAKAGQIKVPKNIQAVLDSCTTGA